MGRSKKRKPLLPEPINGQKRPTRVGIYVCVLYTIDLRQLVSCCKWDGTEWLAWTEMFDPPEWDPVRMQNCHVIDWVDPGDAMRAALNQQAPKPRKKVRRGK